MKFQHVVRCKKKFFTHFIIFYKKFVFNTFYFLNIFCFLVSKLFNYTMPAKLLCKTTLKSGPSLQHWRSWAKQCTEARGHTNFNGQLNKICRCRPYLYCNYSNFKLLVLISTV